MIQEQIISNILNSSRPLV